MTITLSTLIWIITAFILGYILGCIITNDTKDNGLA